MDNDLMFTAIALIAAGYLLWQLAPTRLAPARRLAAIQPRRPRGADRVPEDRC